jgi:transcriptional antiterminator RfaH
MGPYWAVARSEPNREATAVHFLGLAGFATYLPRIREQRTTNGRCYTLTPPLFPSYLFVRIALGWWNARWCVGVKALVMSGEGPAVVPVRVVEDIRGRERNGLVMLPEAPRLKPGDPVHIMRGAFAGLSGLVAGMRDHERVAILLAALGRLTLPAGDVPPCQ